MSQIKGITVTLISNVETGKDDFDVPIYEEKREAVDNVLVSPMLSDDVISNLNLSGKKAVYQLGIPKGDTHTWEDQKVEFFGETFKVFGKTIQGIEANIPGKWNKKVTVELYD